MPTGTSRRDAPRNPSLRRWYDRAFRWPTGRWRQAQAGSAPSPASRPASAASIRVTVSGTP
jgi:hypothetical protein